jgi:hypothetical protein
MILRSAQEISVTLLHWVLFLTFIVLKMFPLPCRGVERPGMRFSDTQRGKKKHTPCDGQVRRAFSTIAKTTTLKQ